MKLIHILYIAIVIWLMTVPSHSSTWEPPVEWDENASWEWLMVCRPAEPFKVFQVSDHFMWEWGAGKYFPMERIDRAERLVQAVIRESRTTEPVATPEPSSVLLLASGLGILVWRKNKCHFI